MYHTFAALSTKKQVYDQMRVASIGLRPCSGGSAAQIAGLWWQQLLLPTDCITSCSDCVTISTSSHTRWNCSTQESQDAVSKPANCSMPRAAQRCGPLQADNMQWSSDTLLCNSLAAAPLLLYKHYSSNIGSISWPLHSRRSQHTWASMQEHQQQQQQQDKLAAAADIAAADIATAAAAAAAGNHRVAAAAGDLTYCHTSSSSSSDEEDMQHTQRRNAHNTNSSQHAQIAASCWPSNSSSRSISRSSNRRHLFETREQDRASSSSSADDYSQINNYDSSSRKQRSKQQQRAEQQAWQQQEAARVTDMRTPAAWYPLARAMTRRLVAHVGPTNSGKTHAALAALMAAPSGVYCGPLRLLACEVADRLNAAGVPCNLVTGQEVRMVPGARHTACTVEMADLEHHIEVAVLDEVQMLADKARGWSWTRVLLGLPAQQIHVCGDPAATGLIQQLADHCHDPLVINRYKRLSPLVVEPHALPGLDSIQEGDCVVAFGRKALHKLRKNILKSRDRQQQQQRRQHGVGMVYGALPPEARRAQAALFNAGPDTWPRYSVLVASDAIGMGLNLNIRRVVFATLHKFDGQQLRPLTPSEVKQIAGRAGRFGGAHSAGYVTCMSESELPLLRQCLATASDEIEEACLLPRFEQLEQYARKQPRALPFYKLLAKFADAAKLSGPFFLADMSNMVALGRVLRHLEPEGLDLEDMFLWCTAPAGADDPAVLQALLTFAELFVHERRVTPACMMPPLATCPVTQAEMKAAEELFRVYDLYLWLAGRVGHGIFTGRKQVQQQRAQVASLIDQALRRMGGLTGNPVNDDGLSGTAAAVAAGVQYGSSEDSDCFDEDEAEIA